MPDVPGLILASTSVYRRELLARLRVPFQVSAPQVDEGELPDEAPRSRATRLAREKARAVARAHPEHLVIGADQVAACQGRILDKPGGPETARAQLRAQSGRAVEFFSAVALVHARSERCEEFLDLSTVVFRTLTDLEIEAYLMADQPYDCAGALRSEGLGISLCERIETLDPTALIGLPLIRLAASLRAFGYPLP